MTGIEKWENLADLDFSGMFSYDPKFREMSHFWTQNQHLWTFLKICLLEFSEIVPDDRY